jgi:hypothetical protein
MHEGGHKSRSPEGDCQGILTVGICRGNSTGEEVCIGGGASEEKRKRRWGGLKEERGMSINFKNQRCY